LIKLLVDEPGTEEAQSAYDSANGIRSTAIAHVEATAALSRMRKGGRLTPTQLRRAIDDLNSLWRGIDSHAVTTPFSPKPPRLRAPTRYVLTIPSTSPAPSPSPLAKNSGLHAGTMSFAAPRRNIALR
jgi:hypothetical protein